MITFDPHALSTSLKSGAETIRAENDAPAVVLQITQDHLSVTAASGVTDYDTGQAARPDQSFEIGSQTKMMTAVLILQLVEEGKIDLDAKAADYLPPEVVFGLANADVATVRQLLNMTSGIANYTEAVDADGIPLFVIALLENPDQVFGPADGLAIARDMEPLGPAGEAFYYSNTNYALLGQIVEGLTGQSFIEALQTREFDPVGMDDSLRQLATTDPRLSSYLDDGTGTLVDVTRAQWEMRGEAGVVSTTADMIGFLKALLVDKTLLGPAALAEMQEWLDTGAGPGFGTFFGLGLVRVTLEGGNTYVGFTGGTLGTGASTYLEIETGKIVSLASTSAETDTASGGLALLQALERADAWETVVDDGGPVNVASGSAFQMRLHQDADGLDYRIGTATLTLDRMMRSLTTDSLTFADGSVVVVGDNNAGTCGDGQANSIDILRDYHDAAAADNQLIGLGGNDLLGGGRGRDRLLGGGGNDQLRGRSGDDILSGGNGADKLTGGAGADRMTGGNGADTFVFRTIQEAGPGANADWITDFEHGRDLIDLSQIATAASGQAFHWLGSTPFDGSAGALRFVTDSTGLHLLGDSDGNGIADLDIRLTGISGLTAQDILL